MILVVADLLVALVAFYLAVLLRFGFDFSRAVDILGPAGPRAAVFGFWMIMGMVSMGMYRARQRPRRWELVARVIVAAGIGGLANVLFFYLIPAVVTGRGVLALAMLLSAVGLAFLRWYLLRQADFNPSKRRILILGAGRIASKIALLRRRADRRRFDILGYVPANDGERAVAAELGLEPLVSLEDGLQRLGADKVVVALDDRRGAFPARELLEQKFSGVPVEEVIEFLEKETEKIDLDVLHPGWLIFAATGHTDWFFRVTKRVFDLLVAGVLLLFAGPFLLIVMAAIRLEDGADAKFLYRQTRVGRNDRKFSLLKFRSMVENAEQDGVQWAGGASDSRVTRTGKIIRRFRIDELPQVFNVLRGEMSIVGPRPERPEFVEQLAEAIPLYDHRHCVRPGLTGWAQLNFPYGASVEDAREKLKYDLYYIKNGNVVFDLFVLLQTLEVVFWGRAISMAGPRQSAEATTTAEDAQMGLVREQNRETPN